MGDVLTEGDIVAVKVIEIDSNGKMRLGGVPVTLAPELNPVYHAGAVFASNYMVTMLAVAARLLGDAGIGEPWRGRPVPCWGRQPPSASVLWLSQICAPAWPANRPHSFAQPV